MKIFGFWHIATINNWEIIVNEQINKLQTFGLLDNVDKIFIGSVGPACHHLQHIVSQLVCNKIQIAYCDKNIHVYEFITLNKLYSICMDIDCYVFYFHTKGVSRPNNIYVESWRRYMEYFNLVKWTKAVDVLKKSDTVGVNLSNLYVRHYSGNFWWSKSQHIRTLPSPQSLDKRNRFKSESWIGRNSSAKMETMCQIKGNLYHVFADERLYRLKIF